MCWCGDGGRESWPHWPAVLGSGVCQPCVIFIKPVQILMLIIHADGSQCVHRVISDICDCVCVCMSVCVGVLNGKWLELSTPDMVDIPCKEWVQHKLTLRSKCQQSRSHSYQMRWGHGGYACQ